MQSAVRLPEAHQLIFRKPRPYDELHDLQIGPRAIRSVIADSAHRTDLNGLRSLLDKWQFETVDAMPAAPHSVG